MFALRRSWESFRLFRCSFPRARSLPGYGTLRVHHLPATPRRARAHGSPDTALRDITQLIEQGLLKKSPDGGRSTGYERVGR